jgi:hypothetical protein
VVAAEMNLPTVGCEGEYLHSDKNRILSSKKNKST